MKTKSMSNKFSNPHEYAIIDDLPSKYRSYSNLHKIYVRELMFDEIRSISKFLYKELDLEQLVNSYRDVIKLFDEDNTELNIETLELADFHYLLVVSSILSDEDAKWTIPYICKKCHTKNTVNIDADQINYTSISEDVKIPQKLAGTGGLLLYPMTVGDKIQVENSDFLYRKYIESELEIDRETFNILLSHAVCIKHSTSDELLKIITNINTTPKLSKLITSINLELGLTIKRIKMTCSECSTIELKKYNFDVIRGYL